ncbi:MAG: hypothetical protein JWM57_4402 [Phycisphaerales bacterium]|nr:hypothetical protein [Phycisphaerales bacterium]
MKRPHADSSIAHRVPTTSPRHVVGVVGLLASAAAVVALGLPVATSQAATLFSAGNNLYGQLGNGTQTGSTSLVPVIGMNFGITSISQAAHSLSVKNGALYGWGLGLYGALGNGVSGAGTDIYGSTPTPQPSPFLTSGVTTLAAGQVFSFAVANGALYSFGTNSSGVLANGTALSQTNATPTIVTGLSSGVTAAAGGQRHALAIQNGALFAWGYNAQGAVGNGKSGGTSLPSGGGPDVTVATPVAGFGSGVTLIAAGSNHSLAVKNNVVYGFGNNQNGAVGNDGVTDSTDIASLNGTPSAVVGLPSGGTVTDIAAGGNANGDWSMALVSGAVYTWGSNYYGQLGDGTTNQQTHAIPVIGITGTIVDIEAGSSSGYALGADGTLWDWGNNGSGQLALGSPAAQFNTPQHLFAPAGYRFSAIAAGTISASILVAESALPVYYTGTTSGSLNNVANFATTVAGTSPAPIATVESTDVFFGTTTATSTALSSAAVVTAMNANSLTFGTGTSATSAVTIGGPGTLTLYADKNTYAAGTGIVVQSGSAAVTINAPLALAQSQSWTTNSAAPLTVNGNVALGTSNLSLAGTGTHFITGVVSGGGSLTVAGTATLSGANTYTGTTTVKAGSLKLATAAQSPVLTGAGGADIQGGKLLLDYTGGSSPIASIKSLLNGEYAANSGNFTAGQIRSTTAAAAGKTIGYGDNGTNTVTLMYTLAGDANLNGTVDFNDFLVLQNNFNAPGTRFDQGNFNYDGVTDFNDFLMLQNNFGQSITGQAVSFTKAQVAAITAFASENVPEPTLMTAAGLGMAAVLRRSRRTPGQFGM